MTVWDKIYKNFNEGGEAWATLDEDIIPSFRKLVESDSIPIKKAFDIGVGTGKYLKLLQAHNFDVSGIDSSPAAVEMTRENLEGFSDKVKCLDMFDYEFPADTYGLILSVSTIHHGMKDDIESLVQKIHSALVPKGKIFITVPDYQSAVDRDEFVDQKKLGDRTYAPSEGPEEGLAHSFYDKNEVENLFGQFLNLEISLDEIGRWVIIGEKS